jgi:8-oxo-dGTP diphosphatase
VPVTTVVAAVIEREGRILIGQRKRSAAAHPLKWEFPGGKVDSGETPEQALLRELQEELAIRATIGSEITRYEFQYPEKPPILLIFCRVEEFDGEPVNQAFETIAWERAENLARYDFLEGDVAFIRALSR